MFESMCWLNSSVSRERWVWSSERLPSLVARWLGHHLPVSIRALFSDHPLECLCLPVLSMTYLRMVFLEVFFWAAVKLPKSAFYFQIFPKKPESQVTTLGLWEERGREASPESPPPPPTPLLLRCLMLLFLLCQTANFLLSKGSESRQHCPFAILERGPRFSQPGGAFVFLWSPDYELLFFKIKVFNFLGVHPSPFV